LSTVPERGDSLNLDARTPDWAAMDVTIRSPGWQEES
jgi:hypothetical protein